MHPDPLPPARPKMRHELLAALLPPGLIQASDLPISSQQKAISGPTAALFVDDLRAFTEALLERGGQAIPAPLYAVLDASMPMLARELGKIPDDVIRDYVRQFADQLYTLAAGTSSPT
jgi:hypothetical protein